LRDRSKDDVVLVAFAGHGVQFKGDKEPYFCPMDAKVSDPATLIALNEVYQELSECRAGLKLLLVDACRNDPLAKNARRGEVNLESVTRPQDREPPGGVAAFFSCSAGEEAYEHEDLRHGVFFHFVIEGLRGAAVGEDNEVTLPSLQAFVQRRVHNFLRGKDRLRQMPEPVSRTRGLVPLVSLRDREVSNSIGLRLVLVPAGFSPMGSPEGEQGRMKHEGPQHWVGVAKPFYMGAFEVTQGQYEEVMGVNPSRFTKAAGGGADHPVEQVSWQDAVEFCKRLSAGRGGGGRGGAYGLPTEVEWEYACRAGTQTPCAFGDTLSSSQANFDGDRPYGRGARGPSLGKTSPVGSYKP